MAGNFFTQSNEEVFIIEYLQNINNGRVLEVGAFDAEIFSNSRRLILNGWEGVLVEPSPGCYKKIAEFYRGNPNVTVINTAIGKTDGKLQFWDNEGAIATAHKEHYDKWKGYDKYELIEIDQISWPTFYKQYPGTYDFIAIDAEGMDWEILNQIDFDETHTKLVCIEWTYNEVQIYEYLSNWGFRLLHKNAENFIMGL